MLPCLYLMLSLIALSCDEAPQAMIVVFELAVRRPPEDMIWETYHGPTSWTSSYSNRHYGQRESLMITRETCIVNAAACWKSCIIFKPLIVNIGGSV
jgi:hypothetical protein